MSHAVKVPGPAIKIISIASVVFVIATLYSFPQFGVDIKLPAITQNTVGTYYEAVRVVDGDTIQIKQNGNLEKVRLIGINTPETVDPRKQVECFGLEASVKMHNFINGKIVKLEYDDSQGVRDAYGRILAYVYLEDGQMINRKMIAEGYAYEYTYITPYKYQKEFRDLQNFARTQKRGLWADETCSGSRIIKQN